MKRCVIRRDVIMKCPFFSCFHDWASIYVKEQDAALFVFSETKFVIGTPFDIKQRWYVGIRPLTSSFVAYVRSQTLQPSRWRTRRFVFMSCRTVEPSLTTDQPFVFILGKVGFIRQSWHSSW
jgi:hypothetical protein